MTLDIRGGLKNTSISTNRYVVLEELLSNAIDSYLIRKNREDEVPALRIEFRIEFFQNSLLQETGADLSLSCTDNGAGFGDEQVRAFVTADTTYKDHLQIQGIGRCKGVGRIQFFHYFKKFKIRSLYESGGHLLCTNLKIDENVREISESNFRTENSELGVPETVVSLSSITDDAYTKVLDADSLRVDFSAHALKNYVSIAFLQRFIILKGIIGDFSIIFNEIGGDEIIAEAINSSDLPSPTEAVTLPLVCTHGRGDEIDKYKLVVTRYSLPEQSFHNSEHEVALCANSAIVMSITKRYLRSAPESKRAIDGKYELILVESEFLEDKVNEQRDGFNIPKECSPSEDFDGDISLQDIVDSLEEYVFTILTPKDFDRDELINATEERFGISRMMLNETNIKVRYTDTEQSIAGRVLKKYQDEIVKETSDIFDLKQELLELDPLSDDFRERVGKLSWKYTSTMRKVDMANLSQLVVRRSSMLEVLEKAVNLMLSCQGNSNGRRQDEKIIHNIFFPTGKDSNDFVDHDIWILNEEYHYFEHISSDKALSSIPWDESESLFDPDIDESLEALFAKNNNDHHRKRPDIAIFNQEGAAIVIELKSPGVELQEHIPDLVQYARLLTAKSKGKIKRIYGYLIGDSLDDTRMAANYKRFPSGLGYFSTDPIEDPATGRRYGELYSEVLYYQQFIDRARNRLKVYKNRLNIDF